MESFEIAQGMTAWEAGYTGKGFPIEFEVTEDHIKLLSRIWWYFDDEDDYYGHVTMGAKRPYGNSNGLYDIAHTLDWLGDDMELTDELEEKALKVHREMTVVVQILCSLRRIEPGTYVLSGPSYIKWQEKK